MFEKYIIKNKESIFVMKFNPDKKTLSVGGHADFRRSIEKFIMEILDLDIPENTHSQKNKVLFKFNNVDVAYFRDVQDEIDTLKGVTQTKTSAHGRLI